MQNRPVRQLILSNLIWFLLSLALAVLVWVTAISQSDPFDQRRLPGIPLRVNPDPGLIITNQSELPPTVTVQLVGQRSVVLQMTIDDVVVTADLIGMGPGLHTVPLRGEAARGVRVNTVIPSQITVNIEVIASQLVPLKARIVNPPPPDIEAGEPRFDVLQVEVSGPESRVQQVVEAEVAVDLQNQRSTYEDDVRPVPVDVDGNVVADVTVQPLVVHVTVPINPSENVREVNVRPRVEGDPPPGYFFTSFDYEPQSVFVSVPSGVTVPDTLFTAPVTLSGRTSDFQVLVPLDLTGTELIPVSESNVTVSVGISAQMGTRQLEAVPVEQIGTRESFTYLLEPADVTLIITAPQPILETLTMSDVRVTADVSALGASGAYSIAPSASLLAPGADATITVLPAQIDVIVESISTTQAATDEP